MTPAPLKIRLREVRKRFSLGAGQVDALDGINLDIRRGEFLCIVGPSGCGKTTLLRIMGGLEAATSGCIEVIRDGASQQPVTSMVFQGHGLYPWLNVRDNIAFGLKARGLARAECQCIAERLMHQVGLGGFGDALPYQLSGGMQQRVSIARALANDPQVLLMDEPFSSVDEQTRLVLQRELLHLWAESGKTVVYVTHSIDEAIALADRIVVMSGRPGRINDVIEVSAVLGSRPPFDQVRLSPHFGELYERVWAQLRGEGAPDGRREVEGSVAGAWSRRATSERVLSILSPVMLLASWEFAARAALIDAHFFPAPTTIAQTAELMIGGGERGPTSASACSGSRLASFWGLCPAC